MKLRLLTLLLSMSLIATVVVIDAGASPLPTSSESCQSYAGSNACRAKGVDNSSSTTWGANVRSRMTTPRININVIGESWWTVRETCNGSITSQTQYGGEVEYNDYEFFDASAQVKHSCGGTRVGWSMGNHDFYKSGYSHIYPYKSHSMTIN